MMAEQTTVTSGGTQITKHTQPVVPNLEEACQASVTTQVVIAEPMTDGTWRLLNSFQDNYNIILEQRETGLVHEEVAGHIREIKEKWKKQGQILSLESLLNTEHPNSLKTEQS